MSIYQNLERRLLASKLSLRSTASGAKEISGYAAKFGTLSQDLGGFVETIQYGAFTRALREKQDVRCLMNHNPDVVLGRTRSGTLTLSQDQTGLFFRCALPNTSAARDLAENIGLGNIDQCSFSFQVPDGGDSWDEVTDENGVRFNRRTLLDLDLFDVSSVTYPAYQDTNVTVNAITNPIHVNSVPQSVLMEARSRAARAGIVIVPRPAIKPLSDDEVIAAAKELRQEKTDRKSNDLLARRICGL